jgi:hypothetical protein
MRLLGKTDRRFYRFLGSEIESARQQIACAALDRLAEFRLEFSDGQLEFGRDGGEPDVTIEAGEKTAAAGAGLDDVGNCGQIVTHGTLNDLIARRGPRCASQWRQGE